MGKQERESERESVDACWLSSAADADMRQREEAAATAAHIPAHTHGVERRGTAIDTPQGAVRWREGEEGGATRMSSTSDTHEQTNQTPGS